MCIRDRINTNKNKIEEISRRELQLQEEVDSWRDRTCQHSHTNNHENRESINFRNYKRNPMEFLKRLEEVITRNRENRWSIIHSMIAVSYTHLILFTIVLMITMLRLEYYVTPQVVSAC